MVGADGAGFPYRLMLLDPHSDFNCAPQQNVKACHMVDLESRNGN